MTAINSNRAIRGPVTAVPVVAGKGVRLVADTENNRIVAEADETVLWEGTYTSDNAGIAFSESYKNFEFIRVEFTNNDGMNEAKLIPTNQTATMINLSSPYVGSAQTHVALKSAQYTIGNTSLVYLRGVDMNIGASTTVTAVCHITVYKVVGVNRIASA